MYNESRGRDSCGYYFSGNVQKGVGQLTDFSDFIASNKLEPGPLKGKIFMGHTRKGMAGGINWETAHPHVVNDNYVQTHNGTLRNPWPMCNKFEVDHNGVTVDSIGLARCIEKMGPKPVLEEYKGYAALAFTWMSNPEALYLYHGASRDNKGGPLESERPLFILNQPEGIYYSSMEESLDAINDTNDEPISLKHNIIFEVVNGELTGKKLYIDRADNNVIETYTSTQKGPKSVTIYPANGGEPRSSNGFVPGSHYAGNNNHSLAKKLSSSSVGQGRNDNVDDANENDPVRNEQFPEFKESDLDRVVYNKGRYYRVTKGTQGTLGTALLSGEYIITRDGRILERETDGPKKFLGPKEERYWFIRGVMIKSQFDYMDLRERNIEGNDEESFIILSSKSRYPIIQFRNVEGIGKNLWFHCGEKVERCTADPKFTPKKYRIRFGKTKEIIGA